MLRATLATLRVVLLAAACAGLGAYAAERGKTEADLKAIASQIEKVRQQVRRDALQKDRLSRDLADAEGSVARVRNELERLRAERGEREKARAALAAERRTAEARLAKSREELAEQVRAAHRSGSREPLKLVLNQQDPARIGRVFTYYGYFGRERAARVGEIDADMLRIEEADARIAAEDAELERLEGARKARLDDLEDARRNRSRVLARLTQESRDRERSLKRLQTQQASLEKLLRDLDRALKDFPVDPDDAFAKLRGQLPWPVGGTVAARFGDSRAGGVRWNGLLIRTERGAPVKAVHSGRVAYADTLPGLGLLLIIDHGGGYLSLYGHNDRLYKSAGTAVRGGETVAAAGDSGGRAQPELYFEIRRAGRPVDPSPWLRGRNPPAP